MDYSLFLTNGLFINLQAVSGSSSRFPLSSWSSYFERLRDAGKEREEKRVITSIVTVYVADQSSVSENFCWWKLPLIYIAP